MTAREWLRANGYDDVGALIDEIQEEWRAAGKRTRRNWWAVLAGGKDGQSLTVAGRTFPVLKAAQRHEGKPVTANAIQRKPRERAPEVRTTGMWAPDGGKAPSGARVRDLPDSMVPEATRSDAERHAAKPTLAKAHPDCGFSTVVAAFDSRRPTTDRHRIVAVCDLLERGP